MKAVRPAHHGPDGRFRNPSGSPEQEATCTEFARFFGRRMLDPFNVPAVPEGHVLAPDVVRAGVDTHANIESMTWLGHAATLFRLAGRTVLIDPFLSATAGPGPFGPKRFAPPGLSVRELPDIDLLLVTHNHYDHLDATTLAKIPRKGRIEVLVPLGLGALLRRLGFERVTELDWYGSVEGGGLTVTALPAIHWSKRGLFDENRSLWCGYLLESETTCVYFTGDTGYGPLFRELGRRVGPVDLTVAGIGAYEPRSIMESTHANPEEAVQIALDIGSAAVMAMHWGTIVLSDEPPFEAPQRFRAAALNAGYAAAAAWTMSIGETRALQRE